MKKLESLAASIFGLAFLVLAIAVTVETIMRKVFNQSLQGVDELGGYILALAGALSFSVALSPVPSASTSCGHLPRVLRVPLFLEPSILACRRTAGAWPARLRWSAALGATAQTPWATPLKYPQALWVAALVPFLVVCAVEVLRIVTLLAKGDVRQVDRAYGPRTAQDELDVELADMKARGLTAPALPKGDVP